MTTRQALLIQPNGDLDVREITGLDDMYAAIGSEDLDWTAPGPLNYICYGQALYELAFNPLAAALYNGTHGTDDPLCGPVLIFGPVKGDEETDVPEKVIRRVVETRDKMGRDKIAELAVPLSDEEKRRIEGRMMASMVRANEALRQGKSVDFGGYRIGVDQDNDPTITEDDLNNLMNAVFGEQTDGNRRQGRKP